jgi:hypothetical protein
VSEYQALERIASALSGAGNALPWILLLVVLWAGRKGEIVFGRELRKAEDREEKWRLAALGSQEANKTILGLLEKLGGD